MTGVACGAVDPDAAAGDDVAIAPDIVLRYGCDRAALPDALRPRFEALHYDLDAQRFVAEALAAPHGALRTALYAGLRRVLSDYDAYGLLRMYAMHLLSTPQLAALLDAAAPRERPRTLLDVGAGSGDVTRHAVPLFSEVAATEASAVMRQRLRARGIRVIEHDLSRGALPGGAVFDAVLCLNVLDRCAYPLSLLRHLRETVAPGGRLLLAVPLPLAPHVQRRGGTADPEEALPAPAASWEAGAASVAAIVERAGLRVERLARAPYLCRGDSATRLHVLDDALFVCSR
jgi:SAM-dependent methyltransferase